MSTKLFLLALLYLGPQLHGDLVLVGSPNFPTDHISATSLKRLFLGHISTIDKKRVRLHQLEAEPLKQFCEGVLKVSLSTYERRWARRIFTGKGRLPRTFKNEASLLKSLSEEDHGLGFIKAGTKLPDGVQIITITP